MKKLALALLVANLAVAVYFLVSPGGGPREPAAFAPLHPERFDLAARLPEMPAVPQDGVPLPAAPQCVAWRNVAKTDFARAREQLKALAGETPLSFSEIPLQTRSWVLYPPLANAQEAARKVQELTASGIRDVLIVNDGPWRHGVSLGLFATAEAARHRLEEVERKGVQGARIEAVPKLNTGYYFVVKSADPEAIRRVEAVAASYPGSRAVRVDCPS